MEIPAGKSLFNPRYERFHRGTYLKVLSGLNDMDVRVYPDDAQLHKVMRMLWHQRDNSSFTKMTVTFKQALLSALERKAPHGWHPWPSDFPDDIPVMTMFYQPVQHLLSDDSRKGLDKLMQIMADAEAKAREVQQAAATKIWQDPQPQPQGESHNILDEIAGGIGNVVSGLGDGLAGLLEGIPDNLKRLAEVILAPLRAIAQAVGSIITLIGEGVTSIVNAVGKIPEAIGGIVGKINEGVSNILKPGVDLWTSLLPVINDLNNEVIGEWIKAVRDAKGHLAEIRNDLSQEGWSPYEANPPITGPNYDAKKVAMIQSVLNVPIYGSTVIRPMINSALMERYQAMTSRGWPTNLDMYARIAQSGSFDPLGALTQLGGAATAASRVPKWFLDP